MVLHAVSCKRLQDGTALQPRSEPFAVSTSAGKWSCTLFWCIGCRTEPRCNTAASRLHFQPPRQNTPARCFLQEVAKRNRTATPQRAVYILNLRGKMVLHTVSCKRLQEGTALQPRSGPITFSTSAAKYYCTLFPARGCKTEPHCNPAASRFHFQSPREIKKCVDKWNEKCRTQIIFVENAYMLTQRRITRQAQH